MNLNDRLNAIRDPQVVPSAVNPLEAEALTPSPSLVDPSAEASEQPESTIERWEKPLRTM